MTALRLISSTPLPSQADQQRAWDDAMRLLDQARRLPSLDNMAKAVDAFRAFERAFGTRVL